MTSSVAPDRLGVAVDRLRLWLESCRFEGWDPHDALNSPLLRRLTFGQRRLGQAWVLALKASPINLRPVLRVARGRNPKGMGLLLSSYCRLASDPWRPDEEAATHSLAIARWLLDNRSPCCSGSAWGYNFDWPNRAFFAPAGTPTIVNTAFVGFAFLDIAATPSLDQRLGEGTALSTARSACDFVLRDVSHELVGNDEVWFSYTPLDRRHVHNASLLGARLLAATGRRTGEPELLEWALRAARFTARRQRDDGQWPYGEGANDGWVDSFHTAYVLVALDAIGRAVETKEFDSAVQRGYEYWKRQMFLRDGTPKFSSKRVFPIDAHVVAQAILTFVAFSRLDAEAASRAERLAGWLVDEFQDAAGFFHYQIRRGYRVRIPYIRWVQAWVLRCLVELRHPLSSSNDV